MAERKKIVLDPGHGGTQNLGGSSWQGCASPGPKPVLEKDLTLRLAQAVKQRLDNAFDVTLTRDRDVNVSLADRAKKANDLHADLFLSIHFNAADSPAADGTETWIAKQASDASKSFAQTVLQRVTLVTGVANRGVRSADLGVLVPARHDPHTAACLVEVAFLTNEGEAARLQDPLYFGHIADALAEAVRAQSAVAITHAVAAGAGASGGSPVALLDPHPAEDDLYSDSMSAEDLERLYALSLDVTIKTIAASNARVHGGPPKFAAEKKTIPQFTKVKVEETQGDFSRVSGMDGKAIGWTESANLGTFFKDDSSLASVAVAPATALAIDKKWNDLRKHCAETYNRLGQLMQKLAATTKIDLAAVLAVWQVESGGKKHTTGKAIIRFEVHKFFEFWGKANAKKFDAHFQFGGHPAGAGGTCKKASDCHKFRADVSAQFEDVHVKNKQEPEYAALAEATAIADEETALRCISIGGPQIMGNNFQLIGYDTAKQMIDAFQSDERAHVLGFFDFCQFAFPHGGLLEHLRKQEWKDFAKGYNGASNADDYATKIQTAFEAATAILPAAPAPAKTKALELGGRSVDLTFAVPLIPQPDKKSCWAASMSMLLSYYRQAEMTPESLAQQVGLSLRTSYGWDMLEAVRTKFLFKEVSLQSNYSYVPPPENWYQWLDQFGPLWVTLKGNPSHAVVVAGISGDLTPANTSIHVLNPWDEKTHFDKDPVDFHPANPGREETLGFNDFSVLFGNMGLADYGHWRILYIGRRPVSVSHGLDVRDLTPEEVADAEPRAQAEAWAEATAKPTRAVLGEADVHWAPDAQNIDYRHLGAALETRPFTLTPALLQRLCQLNRFDINAGQDEVLFGLRGCEFAVDHSIPGDWTTSADLSEAVPDHKQPRCILGVWKRSTGRFRLFTGSTVPNWVLMERYREGGDHANMLPTGRYLFQVGTHRAGTRGEVRGAFLEHGDFVVLRTLNDLEYAIGDNWDSGDFGDNIHPARLDGRAHPPYFSSAGCQTIPGNVNDGHHTGNWAAFRAAAGLSASSPASENGRRFVYALLTGRDARLLAENHPESTLLRLRFGSSGADVQGIQLGLSTAGLLRSSSNGIFDAPTKMAYLRWQTARDSSTTDGVVTPSDGASLGIDMIGGRSIQPVSVSHAIVAESEGARAPKPDEIVTQIDAQQHTTYGNYAGYRASLVSGTIFGQGVSGLRPTFLRKLQRGEAAAAKSIGGSSPTLGIVSAGGYRVSDGFHGWGLAVDLNYDSCPYIMHERGAAALDAELGPVYTRISRLVLKRDSVIPKEITRDNRAASRVASLYDALAEESTAMIRCFGLMQDTSRLAAAISAMPAGTDWRPISGSAGPPTADALQDQLMADYVTLSGRAGPPITGKSYPAPRKSASHRPFQGNPKLRGPELGFLSVRRDLVIALTAEGLRWGAIHFGGESGDVMHFDDGFDEGAGITRARNAAKAAIASGQSWMGESLAGGVCAPDIAIDNRTALIFSKEAPLAGLSDCEHRAVWTAVPDPLRRPFSVLIYFHGNNASVLADTQHPEGKVPAWNPLSHPDLPRVKPNGPFTPGLRDDVVGAAQASAQKPLVLLPEDGVTGTHRNKNGNLKYWAETSSGNLNDPAALGRLIDDSWGHLATLNRPSGAPYLPGGPVCPDERRAFLAGHSGGGLPLGQAAASALAKNVPTDLWLLDSTYFDSTNYVEFCRSWKKRGQLDNNAQSSRMVVITNVESGTRGGANVILQKLQASANGQPGFLAVQFTHGQFCPLSGNCPSGGITPPAGTEIVLITEGASWSDIDRCLRSFPVVFIQTKEKHGEIPYLFFPHLLNTAAVP